MEKRKIILTIIGVAVLLLVSAFIYNKRTSPVSVNITPPAPLETTLAPFKNIVTYKNGLFTPSNFSVKSGVAVSFVNESDEDMWIAANPHPSHTSLSSFDAKRGIKPGETYKYTFVKRGSFGYHDHLHPMSRGTLSVN